MRVSLAHIGLAIVLAVAALLVIRLHNAGGIG